MILIDVTIMLYFCANYLKIIVTAFSTVKMKT